ncbi:MAG: hypothetical protein CMK07_11715 [Ponticaulis sp.]|nr:hypothetical protein [Ponticaulis sp.]
MTRIMDFFAKLAGDPAAFCFQLAGLCLLVGVASLILVPLIATGMIVAGGVLSYLAMRLSRGQFITSEAI